MLLATYVRAAGAAAVPDGADTVDSVDPDGPMSRFGVAGTVLAWFAVGCPVCNKLALLALGYGGAMTWFAPVQPVQAVAALLLTGLALLARLGGQVACRLPAPSSVTG